MPVDSCFNLVEGVRAPWAGMEYFVPCCNSTLLGGFKRLVRDDWRHDRISSSTAKALLPEKVPSPHFAMAWVHHSKPAPHQFDVPFRVKLSRLEGNWNTALATLPILGVPSGKREDTNPRRRREKDRNGLISARNRSANTDSIPPMYEGMSTKLLHIEGRRGANPN